MEVKLDEVKLWLVVVIWLLLWELFIPKPILLQLPPFLDASFIEREIYWRITLKRTWNGNPEVESWIETLNGNLEWELWIGTWWKTSQPNEEDWRGKLEDSWEYSSPIEKLMSLKRYVTGEKPPNPVRSWEGKPDKGSINEKSLKLDEKMWKEN